MAAGKVGGKEAGQPCAPVRRAFQGDPAFVPAFLYRKKIGSEAEGAVVLAVGHQPSAIIPTKHFGPRPQQDHRPGGLKKRTCFTHMVLCTVFHFHDEDIYSLQSTPHVLYSRKVDLPAALSGHGTASIMTTSITTAITSAITSAITASITASITA
ncbi:predicted protein [Plenodomus lingam JN3]|uniref:Predicted protein n=1 Tax=Leptosphaeria maculans (strain JN3 / isolate v23.1.3 / race Av1-4-5-6-7-8) TaxID=985895 RepID=E5AA22_LEPMJ|nr:predicted protein [Plenodomus lingam JN3]CBY00513.1 predicted protein [Plenodomus lingam JN3]